MLTIWTRLNDIYCFQLKQNYIGISQNILKQNARGFLRGVSWLWVTFKNIFGIYDLKKKSKWQNSIFNQGLMIILQKNIML